VPWKPPSRDQRLLQLKAFGLFIRGDHTLYQIAEKLGIAEVNPSTAAGRARTRIEQGWRLICERKVLRWERYWSQEWPLSRWETLRGARLDTHPKIEPQPPPPERTPLEKLLLRIEEVENDARSAGFGAMAEGLRNLRVAVHYNYKKSAGDSEAM
jgi:hypothetical protein